MGNRYMFTSVYIPPEPEEEEIITELSLQTWITRGKIFPDLQLSPGEKPRHSMYTVKNINEWEYSAILHAKAEIVKKYAGSNTIIETIQLPDGTRLNISLGAFLTSFGSDISNVLGGNRARDYVNIVADYSISVSDLEPSTAISIVPVGGVQAWTPSVRGMVDNPTNDTIYIDQAIENSGITLGSSQLFDAIRLASRRIITSDIDGETQDHNKIMFVISDGDENYSFYSINNALAYANAVQDPAFQIFPVGIGQLQPYSSAIFAVIYNRFDSFLTNVPSVIDNGIDDIISFIFSNPKFKIGDVIFSQSFELDEPSILREISLHDITIPSGSTIAIRYRHGNDSDDMGAWSEWKNYQGTPDAIKIDENMENAFQYYEYEIELQGNSLFESPQINNGVNVKYYKPLHYTLFFNDQYIDLSDVKEPKIPINKNKMMEQYKKMYAAGLAKTGKTKNEPYVSSIHITANGDVPETSKIGFRVAYDDTNVFKVDPDTHSILLTRHNEKLIQLTPFKYRAINGGWPSNTEISIFSIISGEYRIVNSDRYSHNNKEGTISFKNSNMVDPIINIHINPVFRVLCDVSNYGSEGTTINHVALAYNVSKRIPVDGNGNTIRQPIHNRI
jgi:hypothetical protein